MLYTRHTLWARGVVEIVVERKNDYVVRAYVSPICTMFFSFFTPQNLTHQLIRTTLRLHLTLHNISIFSVQLALKRVQGTGVPEKGATDDVMLTLLNNAITKLDELLVVVSSTEF